MPIFKQFQRLSLGQKITYPPMAILCFALLVFGWIVHAQWSSATQQQADALGDTLVRQTAREATLLLAAEDTLGLNILLRELVNNPHVAQAVVYSPDNSILAQAGQPASQTANTYSHQLVFQRVLAGTLQIQLDIKYLQQPMHKSQQSIILLAILLLVAALFLLARLGNSIQQPLKTLRHWLKSPLSTAPHIGRQDEIGQLAQALDALLAPPVLEDRIPEENSAPPADAHLDVLQMPEGILETRQSQPEQPEKTAESTIALAVQLDLNTRKDRLDSQRLTRLFDRYHHALSEAARLYGARLLELEDGRSLLLFDDRNEHYVRYSLCCGELLRAFGHSLQIDIADSDAIVSLKLGLSHGPALKDTDEPALLEEPLAAALNLSEHSRNLLLLSSEFAGDSRTQSCARTRNISRPENTHCVERLLEPYPAQLDKQLHELMRTTANPP